MDLEDDMEDITIKFRLTGEECPTLDVRDDLGIGPPQRKRLQSASSRSDDGLSEEENSDADSNHDNVNKPLMYPRQRPRIPVHGMHRRSSFRRCMWGTVYLFVVVAAILAGVFLVIYFVNSYTNRLLIEEFKEQWTDNLQAIPCNKLKVEDVWVKGFPKLLTESAFRLLDINKDGVLDIVMGFATGGDKLRADMLVCDIYFNGSKPCGGGIMALDGATGAELWRRYSVHEIFSLNCNSDLDGDGLTDCIGGGRAGTFMAVSSVRGALLWTFNDTSLNDIMNLYTGQFVDDLDLDGVRDILNIHGGDPLGEPGSSTRLPGKLIFFSGKTGKVLKWSYVPDMRESYYSPVLFNNTRGLQVLFGTGGETHPGSLWRITLKDLWEGHIDKAQRIFTDQFKGIMTPPVLIDLTQDATVDIVFATYNSTILAVDGETYRQLWNYSFPSTETYATPGPGYFNNDSVPDFLVRWQYGPGFPIYYHSIMTILDGKTGKPLIEPFPRDSVGSQSSPLTVSMETQGSQQGHDLFLYWIADCMFHQGEGGEFRFKNGTNVHEQSRSDFCKLRYQTDGFSQLLAYSQSLPLPGFPLYTSYEREDVEHAAWVNTTQESIDYLRQHPQQMQEFLRIQGMIQAQKDTWRQKDKQHENKEEEAYPDYLGNEAPAGQNYPDLAQSSVGRKSGHQTKQRWPSVSLDTSDRTYKRLLKEYEQNYVKPRYNNDDNVARYWNSRYTPGDYGYKTPPKHEDISPSQSDKNFAQLSQQFLNEMEKKYRANADPFALYHYNRNNVAKGNTPQRYPYRRYRAVNSHRNINSNKRAPHDRQKRHLGPHDGGGLQRLISTGTLAPSLLPPTHKDYHHSMDVVFATYWFFPAKTNVLLPEDEACIAAKMATETERFKPDSKYYGMDHDGYQHVVQDECLELSGHQLPPDGTYESQATSTAYNLHMGQMTVYRLRITCQCGDENRLLRERKRCLKMLPYSQQQWAGYMGTKGDSIWVPHPS